MSKVGVLVTVQFKPRWYEPAEIVTLWQVAGPSAEFLELLRQHLGLSDWEVITDSSGQAMLRHRQLGVVPSVTEIEKQAAAIWAGAEHVEDDIQMFRLLHKAAGLDGGGR